MPCKPCTEKWIQYYLSKGKTPKQAANMAKKLMRRLDKRLKSEKVFVDAQGPYVPLYLLEKAGEGINLYYGAKSFRLRFHCFLHHWFFKTNWRASFLWSFKTKKLLWIGRGGSDYTLNCTGSNATPSCEDNGCMDQVPPKTCVKTCTGGTCVCPSPTDPHSHQVSSTCAQAFSGSCSCKKAGSVYGCVYSGMSCACGGACGYSCDSGYSWNGSQCIAAGTAYQKTCSEILGLKDGVGARTVKAYKTDILGLKDRLGPRSVKANRTEVLGLKDSFSTRRGFLKVVSEILGMVDSFSSVHTLGLGALVQQVGQWARRVLPPFPRDLFLSIRDYLRDKIEDRDKRSEACERTRAQEAVDGELWKNEELDSLAREYAHLKRTKRSTGGGDTNEENK